MGFSEPTTCSADDKRHGDISDTHPSSPQMTHSEFSPGHPQGRDVFIHRAVFILSHPSLFSRVFLVKLEPLALWALG